MKEFLLLFIFLLGITIVYAQDPSIVWQNTIGGNNSDDTRSICQTVDGGYFLGGVSKSSISGDKTENTNGENDYWVLKLNETGDILWQNTIGGSNNDYLSDSFQTTDGGYLLLGYSYSNISGDKTENSIGEFDYWVIKIDSEGNIQWQNTIGGSGYDALFSGSQTTDGGYILGGSSDSNASGDKVENSNGDYDYWVVKLDVSGAIEWQNTIGGSLFDGLTSVAQTIDGGYILGGGSLSNISGDKTENSNGDMDYWVVKLDSTGGIEWQNTIGGSDYDFIIVIEQSMDGGYIIGGRSSSNSSGDKTENSNGMDDYWVVKLDATGAIVWQNTIGGSLIDQFNSISETSDGGYIMGGSSTSNASGDKTENSIGGGDFWIVKIDSSGEIEWDNTIGGDNGDGVKSITQTSEGGYICGGSSNSGISGDKTEASIGGTDMWIIYLLPILGVNDYYRGNSLSIFPNPVQDTMEIIYGDQLVDNITIYASTGTLIKRFKLLENSTSVDVSQLAAGVYFIRFSIEGKTVTKKFIKE
jgi:type IX secretion system substrate protein